MWHFIVLTVLWLVGFYTTARGIVTHQCALTQREKDRGARLALTGGATAFVFVVYCVALLG